MKKSTILLATIILITACSRKFEKFELFSAESFAYSMDSGWELNASVRAKGFEQVEESNKFTAKLSYFADIQTPDGRLLEKISSGVVDKTSDEKLTDLPIEIQIKLDSAYKLGIYKITFFVKDDATGKKEHLSSFFELSK
jgi:hypothetical protein